MFLFCLCFHFTSSQPRFCAPSPHLPQFQNRGPALPRREEVEEDDDEESDSDPHDDLLAARQINGDSEAEDEGFVNGHDGNSDGGGCGSDGGSDCGGGGSGDDDDIANDKGNDGAMDAAAAEGRPEERRSSMRAGRFEGSLEDRGVNKISPRPTPRKKKAKPNQRLRDRTRNRERFAAKTAAARAEFLAVASSAVEKLGAALDAWLLGKEALWYEHIVDPVQLGDCARAELPRAKVAALVKRAQVVHRYLQLQVKSGNSFRLQNQREVAEAMNISAQLVASWTRDFMHLEPHSDFHAAAGGDTAPVEHRPLTSPPLNPYTVSSEVMPIENDKHIRALATWFVRANANVKGRANMKASDFQRWCITFLIPNHLSAHPRSPSNPLALLPLGASPLPQQPPSPRTSAHFPLMRVRCVCICKTQAKTIKDAAAVARRGRGRCRTRLFIRGTYSWVYSA